MATHHELEPDDVDPGRALWAFLEAEWRALGTNCTRWCRENGVSDSTVTRWGRFGSDNMQLHQLRLVARGLRRPLTEILLAARLVTPEEVHGRQVVPREAVPTADAIAADPALSEHHRDALLGFHQLWLDAAGVAAPPRRRPRRPHRAGGAAHP